MGKGLAKMLAMRDAAKFALEVASDATRWQSIVINKRRPHTYRAFLNRGESRICLHRFEPCKPADSFAHPHPWLSSMLVLAGEYDMVVGRTSDLVSADPADVIQLTLSSGSIYSMEDRHTWHQVIPKTRCYSLMVNGPRWENAHRRAPTTSGKGLESMSERALLEHLEICAKLLTAWLTQS